MALLLRNGIYVAVTNGGELPENAVWCSLLHVAAVEPISSESKNGRRKRRN
jgi:hypothetical protein